MAGEEVEVTAGKLQEKLFKERWLMYSMTG
jgi:hypothetical protein